MTLTLSEYQNRARETETKRAKPDEQLVIALLGLVGEAGSLLTEYKKRLRDGDSHQGFDAQVAEELGDILWYVATIASNRGLSLAELAEQNLVKTRARWLLPDQRAPLFDEDRDGHEQLPRTFEYRYEERVVKDKKKVVLVDQDGSLVGDPLTDNAYEDDGYRFHDVLHLAHAVVLGWSPVTRAILKRKRKSNDAVDHKDEVEDGARAQVLEEAIAAITYDYALRHDFMKVERVDWDLLRTIKRLTANLEVRIRTEAEWEQAMLLAFRVFREVRAQNGGTLRGDLRARTLEVLPAQAVEKS